MRFDLKSIETFIYVAQLKSFIGAAEKLNIAKSHVSTRISELERKAEMTLLARTTRDVNLTGEGEEFLQHCEKIMDQVQILEDFLNAKKEIAGVLKLAIPPYFSRYHIVPYLKEFMSLYPKLRLDVSLTEDPVNLIEESYDLQVRIQIPDEESLKTEKLMTNHKIVCASKEYLKKNGTPKTPEDLLDHNCIIFGENKIWEFRDLKTKKITQLKKLNSNIKCNNGEIIKELILAGDGITMKSARDIEDEIASGKIVVLLEDYEVMHKTWFYAVYPSKKYKSPKIKAFIDFYREKLGG